MATKTEVLLQHIKKQMEAKKQIDKLRIQSIITVQPKEVHEYGSSRRD